MQQLLLIEEVVKTITIGLQNGPHNPNYSF